MNKLIGFIIIIIIVLFIIFKIVRVEIIEKKSSPVPNKDIIPQTLVAPLLTNYYSEKSKPKLSDLTYQEMSKAYPIFAANSMKNNNIKNWALPNNGTCSPAEFCDAIYLPNNVSNINSINNINTWEKNNTCSKRINMY